MIIFGHIMILFGIGVLLSIPMLGKPLSEDDGCWFYLAVFWRRGERFFKTFHCAHGYFGIQWIFAKIYNVLNLRDISATYYFKALWYIITAISIYWMAFCFWHNYFLSFIAGLIFIIITAIPNTLFALTYAEHCFIFPINLSLIFSYYGITSGLSFYFILAGLMSSWAFQFKPTALLLGVLLPVIFCFAPNPALAIVLYTATFICIYLVPLYLIRNNGERGRNYYLNNSLGPIVHLIEIFLSRFSIEIPNKYIEKIRYSEAKKAYTKEHHSLSTHDQWLLFKINMMPVIKDLYLVIILAATQIILLFVHFDPFSFLMIMLFIVFLLMQQFQKNYYTPHFNPVWAPISILAAKTIKDIWPFLLNSGALGWSMALLMVIEGGKICIISTRSFLKRQRDAFGLTNLGVFFRLAETIGKYIKQCSKENERLLVWGVQPSIYLYSEREAFDVTFLNLYPNQRCIDREDELLELLRKKPPEWIVFFNHKVNDGWNINRLQETIGIPYNFLRSFKITDNQGKTFVDEQGIIFDFPVYRRDDEKYKEVLLDRAVIARSNGDNEEARKHIENILEIFPKDYEALIWLSLLENDGEAVEKSRTYLEEELIKNHDSIKYSILLRLLANIDVAEGDSNRAKKKYEKAIEYNPKDFRGYNSLGELYFSMGQPEKAFECFKKALAINQYSADVLNNMGVVFASIGNRGDAFKCFKKALSFMSSHPDVLNNMKEVL